MLASIMTALGVCLFWQHTDLFLIVEILVNGYKSPDPSISSMIDGGGIMSMVRVALIITISSSYSGIFEETGLLNGLKSKMGSVSRKITVFGTILMTSMVAGMVACNQTLATMLVDQVCKDLEPDQQKFAIDMETPGNRYGSAHSVVHRGCGSAGVCVGAACVDRGGGVPVSASNLASYCESQEGCLINFNFSSFG